MLRAVVVTAALALLPLRACAEEVWRWQDPQGVLHYSNDPSKVPAEAEPVRTQIRVVAATPPRGAARMRAEATRYAGPVVGVMSIAAFRGCFPPAYAYIILNNSHELADQVKQASLLDALGISWRASCR